MAEVARILRPVAPFAFTAREQHAAGATFGTPARPDYRPPLRVAGLEIETYEETPEWAERQVALLHAMAAASWGTGDPGGGSTTTGANTWGQPRTMSSASPNNGLELTAYSVRSCLLPASSSSSGPAFGGSAVGTTLLARQRVA